MIVTRMIFYKEILITLTKF